MLQRDLFLVSEGDRYFRRNPMAEGELDDLGEGDPLLRGLVRAGLRPRRVLEIGAGNGWRLACLRRRDPEIRCEGLEPSREAVADGSRRFPGVGLVRGTAESLPYGDRSFDLVIFGFCLYLCDRGDLFCIAREADRVLEARGHVAILDFFADTPRRTPYEHSEGVFSHKMDYARMFLWSPLYRSVYRETLPYPGSEEDSLAVSILQRDDGGG